MFIKVYLFSHEPAHGILPAPLSFGLSENVAKYFPSVYILLWTFSDRYGIIYIQKTEGRE
jgi:hypothetical protein